jgi:hypothetical protein
MRIILTGLRLMCLFRNWLFGYSFANLRELTLNLRIGCTANSI